MRTRQSRIKHDHDLTMSEAMLLLAPLPIGFEDHFDIGMPAEMDSLALEFRAYFSEVVDLAVVDDPVAGGGVVHGLMAEGGKIQNCETAIPETDFDVCAAGIAKNDCAENPVDSM